jgi:hypothetical protein
MNKDLADYLKGFIEPLPFADRVAGLVQPLTIVNEGPDNKPIKKTYPIACGVTAKDCLNNGKYQHLLPDDRLKSLFYFEDLGIQSEGKENGGFKFTAKLRLVGWMNLKKLGKTDCSYSALAIASILNAFPTGYQNNTPYTRIQVEVTGQEPKLPAIFSKYSLDEEKTQFLLYPFDYFALQIAVSYVIPKSCLSALTVDNELSCTND